jgi:hypothetical protein
MLHSKPELANIVNWPNLESKMLTAKSQQEVEKRNYAMD